MIYEYFDIPKPNVVMVQAVIVALALPSASLVNVQWDEISKTGLLGTTRRLRIQFSNELNALDRRNLDEAIEPFGYDIPIGHYTEKQTISANDLFIVEDSQRTEDDPKYLRKRVKLSGLIASTSFCKGAESAGQSSTSSSSYQQKLRLTFTPPRVGWYEVNFTARMACNAANKLLGFRIQFDDATTKIEVTPYPNLSLANGIYVLVGGNVVFQFVDTNQHFVDMDYKSNGSNIAYIEQAVMTIREIGATL